MKTLILYYSYSGNTRSVAELLGGRSGADLCEIRPAVPYTGSYSDVVAQGQAEVNQGATPALLPLEKDPADYGVILLGTPVWWYTYAPAVRSLFARYDFFGKEVYPFMTNGGWVGHTERDIAAACPGAKVGAGIDIRFNGKRMATSEAEILRWAEESGLSFLSPRDEKK